MPSIDFIMAHYRSDGLSSLLVTDEYLCVARPPIMKIGSDIFFLALESVVSYPVLFVLNRDDIKESNYPP